MRLKEGARQMTAGEAYDDCIAQAREGARRQRDRYNEEDADEILRELHKTAAITLESFADVIEKIKAIRCAQ